MRLLSYLMSFCACGIMSLNLGCASGGFKLTRQYARWVNSNNVILRVVLYLLTGIVFAVTLLIDMVIFNTVDFWQGKVSQGDYKFKDGEKTFFVQHRISPDTKLKTSHIEVKDGKGKLLQDIALNETASGEIEFFVDGKLRSRVRDIHSLPVASVYDDNGVAVQEKMLWSGTDIGYLISDIRYQSAR